MRTLGNKRATPDYLLGEGKSDGLPMSADDVKAEMKRRAQLAREKREEQYIQDLEVKHG